MDSHNPKVKVKDYHGQNLRGHSFEEETDFAHADFSGCILKGAKMSACFFQDANLSCIIGEDINFSRSTISMADLSGANLRNANLTYVMFASSNMTNSCLIKADLTNANLSNTILVNVDLRNANLTGTSFKGAEFFPTVEHISHVTILSLLDSYHHLYANDKNYSILKPFILEDFILKMKGMLVDKSRITEVIFCLEIAESHPFFTKNINAIAEFFGKKTDSAKEITALLEIARNELKKNQIEKL